MAKFFQFYILQQANFDVSRLNRTMTINSQRRLISQESAAKIADLEKEKAEKSKKSKKKSKKEAKPVENKYRYPGCCVSMIRILLSLTNLLTLLFGLAVIM